MKKHFFYKSIVYFSIILLLGYANNYAAEHKRLTTVLRIIDGDTLKVKYHKIEESVRLIGIDTPECRGNKKAKKDAKRSGKDIKHIITQGREAKKYIKTLVKCGDLVTLDFDVQKRDRYGRLLGYV